MVLMQREIDYVRRLTEIIAADDQYFDLAAKLAIRKIRGPVDDADSRAVNDAFNRAMELRQKFTADNGGICEPSIVVER